MDPPSPSKRPMTPGMPIFPASPERAAGVKSPYGAPQSPSLPDLRTSPLRSHRRNDSDVSVHGLAAMFENLEVKDFKEAQAKYLQALQKQKSKHASEMKQLEKSQALALQRQEMRQEELRDELRRIKDTTQGTIPREIWDRQRQEHRDAITKWEKAMQYSEEKRKQAEIKAHELTHENGVLRTKYQQHKKRAAELHKDNLRATGMIPTFQAKIQGLERNARIAESDLKFHAAEADKYKNQVYGLQVELESLEARLGEEVQTLKDKLSLVEGERDALKTSLKEEEVLRIAAEGHIPLPDATTEEHDEFASPARSPRKPRSNTREDDDKENVAPKKATVEIKFLQQELATEKRLRERAQDQIDFMKMECQFQCCSCRIADVKGAKYVHDNSYAVEMERIRASFPVLTPPASNHEDEPMEGVVKQEPSDEDRPLTPALEQSHSMQADTADQTLETTVVAKAAENPDTTDTEMMFSPNTGTFRTVPSPAKGPSHLSISAITGLTMESSLDTHGTSICTEDLPQPVSRTVSHHAIEQPADSSLQLGKTENIPIHEDAIDDEEEENDVDIEPEASHEEPSGPITPYFTRTITTTTTIPLHFSPMTPAAKPANPPLTPSTVAHAPKNAQTPVLGELTINKLPIDREAALEAIRQRRGRARSMAAGHGTPRKQMMEGVHERRDISAPVSRIR